MKVIIRSNIQRIIAVLIILPLAAFAMLRLLPTWDLLVWDMTWHSQLIYFYLMVFASLMAFLAGVFVRDALSHTTELRVYFTRLAFIAFSLFALLTSITTPETLFNGMGSAPFRWAARLSLFISACFFFLSIIRWKSVWNKYLKTGRYYLGVLLTGSAALFLYTFYFHPEYFTQAIRLDPLVKVALASLTIGMFLWTARHNWLLFRQNGNMIDGRLAVAMLLFAEAQIIQTGGLWGRLSWLLHGPVILLALIVALSALVKAFHSLRDLQPARFFAVLGSIAILALALVSGELARGLTVGVHRRFIVSLTLIQGGISFILMYIIVLGLDHAIHERNEALKREQKLRNELTRLIVHDLKNPLMITTQGANLLNKGILGEVSPEQKKLLERMELAGQKTLHLIDDLLDVERMEADAIQLQRAPLDLWQLLSKSVADFQVLASANQQILTLETASHLPQIAADETLLYRVMDNIITNALKFTPDGGHVIVRARSDENYLMIEVADSGPGIPPTLRDQVFEKFSQVHNTERRGAGLGLTFCKMAVEAHRGTIAVEDSELGGALFKISLPLHTALSLGDSQGMPQPAKKAFWRASLYTTLFSRL
ncbi:MAG: ATP-binding protein [Anaerolineae bacterium]